MHRGIIIKGVGGFYYVKEGDAEYQCRARGLFKKEGITPCVGDRVEFSLDLKTSEGLIENILPRKTFLIRPCIANVDTALIVMSVKDPKPNLMFLDRLMIKVAGAGLETLICFNKIDLDPDKNYLEYTMDYERAGYKVVYTSVKTGWGIDELMDGLKESITVLAGPSGVGKSSILNQMIPGLKLKVRGTSKKIGRGRHTTRHTQLFQLPNGGMVADTPGFTSLDLKDISSQQLSDLYREFEPFKGKCRFSSCLHATEPGCSVRHAMGSNKISRQRYERYLSLLKEIKETEASTYD
ncbi:MAG TPA: ribosome small subunit-dependent GTPase A [Clostridiales bacterium]|nr:ribosome small subunit-dependent GTPase A [Clostridiales bacterium]